MAQKKTPPRPKKASTPKKSAPVKAARKDLSLDLVDLTPEEMRALPRPREGFEKHVAPLLALYAAEQDEIGIKALSTDDIQTRFAAYKSLEPIEASASKHLEMVQETRALHAAKVWTAMLEIYAKAQAAARTNDQVRRGIADFTAFMALGPRKKKAPKPG